MSQDIHIAVEDELSQAVLTKTVNKTRKDLSVSQILRKNGFGYLKKNIVAFNLFSANFPIIVLTDLDTKPCPSALIKSWIQYPISPNMLLRVAVRSIESWVLADRKSFSSYFETPITSIPLDTDDIYKPKLHLLNVITKSKNKEAKLAILPGKKSNALVGELYNDSLCKFVVSKWNPIEASKSSDSLKRAIAAIASL